MTNRIAIIGNTNLDIMVSDTPDLPAPGTERIVPRITMRVGGSAGNLAIRCAGLGHPTTLVSRVGDDASTTILTSDLDIEALTAVLIRDAQEPSAITVAIEAPGRDRAFLSSLGAMRNMTPNDVPDDALEARFVVLAGYFLLPGLHGDNLAQLFNRAHATGAKTVLDTGWPPQGWTTQVRAEIMKALAHVDIFLPNVDELYGLTQDDDPHRAALRLAALTETIVGVKRGSRGAGLATPDGCWIDASTEPTTVIDSTGAGDGFNAALLVGACRGTNWADSLAAAVRYATRLVATPEHLRANIEIELSVS
ncbi:carbohydrate kinase family protein [Cryobacterium sp. MLB-32]|uniref:carbohydrate kinase family protein n=1 Tax=Cryobacterium sp. MLB-32 TaxID=1529318 RepID=UPI0012E07E6C|nr:carbohydrate kinase family protein [Cryobacterium sp. MLB-32]